MSDFDDGPRRPSIAIATVKTVAVVGLLSWLAAGWLSSASRDQATLSRLAANISRGFDDPLTTGSIQKQADASRIDPCSTATRR